MSAEEKPASALASPGGRVATSGVLLLGVSVILFVLGGSHPPDYLAGLFGQHGLAGLRLKAELATGLLGLALVQLILALWMYGRLPRRLPPSAPRTAPGVGIRM